MGGVLFNAECSTLRLALMLFLNCHLLQTDVSLFEAEDNTSLGINMNI